jgi:hypothetical protein
MDSKPIDRVLHAQDIYPVWRTRIRAAEKSITVFSPFLDCLLVEILANAGNIDPSNILVITDFKNATFLEHPAQLQAIKALLRLGISVRTLPLLHAKVLLTDDEHVVLGSQNFTKQGRKNKETSSVLEGTTQASRSLQTLLEWADTADPIEEALVDRLLKRINPLAKRLKETKEELETELDAVVSEHAREQKTERRRRLDEQERRSTVRLARGAAYARVRTVSSSDGGLYDSLLVEPGYDLTKWVTIRKSGDERATALNRLWRYPVLIEDTLQIVFVRLGKTRITYFWTFGPAFRSWVETPEGNWMATVEFPSATRRKGNIKVTLKPPLRDAVCKVWLLFDGLSLDVRSKRFSDSCSTEVKSVLENACFRSHDWLSAMLRHNLAEFRKQDMHADGKREAQKYFTDGRYRLSLIPFLKHCDVPILLARRC